MKTVPFGKPILDDAEKDAVIDALNSPQLVHGPLSEKFESKFSNFVGPDAHSSSVASATAGLYLSYLTLGIGLGDEVIVTSLTHVATANAILACGAEPVFVDVNIDSGNIDLDLIEDQINEKTKAISVVHFLGNPVNMSKINQIASKYGLRVIEDCALALGSRIQGIHVGLWGDLGVFSFYPAKHITTGEGGMIVSRHEEIIRKASRIKSFHYDKSANERDLPGVYDIDGFGMNLRMSEISAAIGIQQLSKLPLFLSARERNYNRYLERSSELVQFGAFISSQDSHTIHSHYCISFLLNSKYGPQRNEILKQLKRKGIGVSVYYPVVIPYSRFYSGRAALLTSTHTRVFGSADRIAKESIAFPVGPHVSNQDVDYIIEIFLEILMGLKSNV